MNAVVTKVYDDIVHIKTDYGSAFGKWCSNEPIIEKRYIIELDCNDIVVPESVKIISACSPSIMYHDECVVIRGYVEQIEDDILFLRVAEDLLMLNVASAFDSRDYINKYVCIRLSNISFYDTGLC